MGGAGRVYAWDVHEHRVQLIRAAARRLGLDNVRATVYDARQPMEGLRLSMDAVLVDQDGMITLTEHFLDHYPSQWAEPSKVR